MRWRNPIRATYEWVLRWADHPQGHWALAGVAFAESSFFPIPPDVLLIPLCLSAPRKAPWFAALCTASSVVGGIFGYVIGMFAYQAVGARIVEFYGMTDTFNWLDAMYGAYTGWFVAAAGFTPIPYKVFTIAAGAFEVAFPVFVVASIIGRGGRFFLVAGLLWYLGEPVKDFIDRWFNLLTVAVLALIVGGFLVVKFLFR